MKLHNFLLLLALSLIILSCNEDNDPPLALNKLVAKAGADQNIQVNSIVTLDGSGSIDGNNKPFAFQWTFKSKPLQSTCVIENADTATPAFAPDVAGLYTVELKIIQGDFFKTDEVNVVASITPLPNTNIIDANISQDKVLEDVFEDPSHADYLVTADVIVTAKLTIAPGVVIEFEADKSLQIFPGGTLVAKGSGTENIILTGKEKNKGYWKGVLFISNSAENELDRVIISFAGSNPLPEMGMVKTNVGLAGGEAAGSAVKISNSNFTESGGYGLYVGGMSQLDYFSGNYFTNNTSSALYVPAGQLHKLDFFSHYTGNNGYNGVETGGTVKQIAEATWSYFNDGSKYLVSSDLSIESGVHISEGATFEFAKDILLQVVDQGYLNATGTSVKPVVFTAKVKTPDNFWRGISFASSQESNSLQHVVISHAGIRAMPDITVKANLAVAPAGKVSVLNSKIENGLGWGIVAEQGAQINGEVITSNYLSQLAEGKYKFPFSEAITASLAGDWLDQWSFNNQHAQISANFFDQDSQTWFNGGADPWSMSPQTGFGLKINADGSYLWTIAEHSPSSPECVSYSAEYITGNVLASGEELSFAEDSWRSKFYNSCDTEQNVDMNVQPGSMVLRYEINRMYNVLTYAEYWQLRIINPDNSSFTYYKF